MSALSTTGCVVCAIALCAVRIAFSACGLESPLTSCSARRCSAPCLGSPAPCVGYARRRRSQTQCHCPSLENPAGCDSSCRWQETIKLTASDADVFDRFGVSVAIEDKRLLVGASRDDEHANDAGAAYLLTSRSGVWELEAKLLANQGNPGDALGFSVALGSYIVTGAETLDIFGNGETLIDAGGAYALDRSIFSDGFENGDLSPWNSVDSS